jgi:hypothetical protein
VERPGNRNFAASDLVVCDASILSCALLWEVEAEGRKPSGSWKLA